MTTIRKPELLSPAGSYEKFEYAIRYGADAVYLAGKQYGMRSSADNFTTEEITRACGIAHSLGKRVHITLNTHPRDHELEGLAAFLRELAALAAVGEHLPDAAIVADLGVMGLVKEILPAVHLHISTQANTSNHLACMAYHRMGASRIVLSRELSLDEIKAIRDRCPPELELECFVHGAMCVSYSGRCLLSNHFVRRDANRGACAQPCRWKYTADLTEEKRPDLPIRAEQDGQGTYLLSSRDLCMIQHVDKLIQAGIDSFKIEGRMKSPYYAAVITNAYRMAIDAYANDPIGYQCDPRWMEEIASVSHREYDTGFYFDQPIEDAKILISPEYIRDKAFLGLCIGYDEQTGMGIFSQRNKIVSGQSVQIVSPYQPGRTVKDIQLYTEEGEPIPSAPHPLMVFKLACGFRVGPGDILRGE